MFHSCQVKILSMNTVIDTNWLIVMHQSDSFWRLLSSLAKFALHKAHVPVAPRSWGCCCISYFFQLDGSFLLFTLKHPPHPPQHPIANFISLSLSLFTAGLQKSLSAAKHVSAFVGRRLGNSHLGSFSFFFLPSAGFTHARARASSWWGRDAGTGAGCQGRPHSGTEQRRPTFTLRGGHC